MKTPPLFVSILYLSLSVVTGQQVYEDNHDDEGITFLCRCELPGENIYNDDTVVVPLRIGNFYVLDEHHDSCAISQTPLIDAVVHGVQHWVSVITSSPGYRPHRSLNDHNEKATPNGKNLRFLSHSDEYSAEAIEAEEKHGIASFPCPDSVIMQISSLSPSAVSPSPAPQVTTTELPSVQVPTLDIIDTNVTSPTTPSTDGTQSCPANITELSIDQDGLFISDAGMAISWNVVTCNDTETFLEERDAVWVSVIGNGELLQASTCAGITSFQTSLQVLSGDCSNLTCVVENEFASGNCPSPNIFGSTVTWYSEPNEQYWILIFPRGVGTGSSDRFGLSVVSVSEEETTVPTAAPISNIFGRATLYPTAAPLANINPVYQGVSIVDDNHSCESAVRLFARTDSSDSVLGTTIGAANSTTCWSTFETPTVWFWVIGTGQILEITMSERVIPFPPLLSVLTGVSCDDEQFACLATGLDSVAWQSSIGERYWILLQGRVGAGDYGLMIRSYN